MKVHGEREPHRIWAAGGTRFEAVATQIRERDDARPDAVR